jgi:hypothetical protein
VTLEEAITQLVNLGEKDPVTIVEKLLNRHGAEWLREQGAFYASDFAAEMARRMLSAGRRSSEIALRPGDQVTTAELKVRSYWVPEQGWKPAAELTPNDLRARALFYERLAHGAMHRAVWCREVADLMEAEGAPKLGKLKAALPPLPSDGEIPLLEVAV